MVPVALGLLKSESGDALSRVEAFLSHSLNSLDRGRPSIGSTGGR
jgi:hypothetical protein